LSLKPIIFKRFRTPLLRHHHNSFYMEQEHQLDVSVFLILFVRGNRSSTVFMGVLCLREQVNNLLALSGYLATYQRLQGYRGHTIIIIHPLSGFGKCVSIKLCFSLFRNAKLCFWQELGVSTSGETSYLIIFMFGIF